MSWSGFDITDCMDAEGSAAMAGSSAAEFQELSQEKTVSKNRDVMVEMDEGVVGVARALQLLNSDDLGGMAARESIITGICERIPALYNENPGRMVNELLPMLAETLGGDRNDVLTHTGRAVISGFQEAGPAVDLASLAEHMLVMVEKVLKRITRGRQAGASSIWIAALRTIAPLLSLTVMREQLPKLITRMSAVEMSISVRSGCPDLCATLLARLPESADAERAIALSLLQALARDISEDVRLGCCDSLAVLVDRLDTDTVETKLYPLFQELSMDDDPEVRLRCLDFAADIGVREPSFPGALKIAQICLPVLRHCIDTYQSGLVGESNATTRFITIVGRAMYALRNSLSDHDMQEACTLCHHLFGTLTEQHSQALVVRNLPALARVVMERVELKGETSMSRKSSTAIFAICGAVINSTSAVCRYILASGLHEILAIANSDVLLRQAARCVTELLNDTDAGVLAALLPELGTTFSRLRLPSKAAKAGATAFTTEIVCALMHCDTTLAAGAHWRARVDLLQFIQKECRRTKSRQLFARLPKYVMTILETATTPKAVQQAAIETLCTMLRHSRREDQRQVILLWIRENLAEGDGYFRRALFVSFCEAAIATFSRSFFKEHLYATAVKLGSDPTDEVRIQFCRLATQLKLQLELPTDRPLLTNLESVVDRLVEGLHVTPRLHVAAEEAKQSLSLISADDIWRGSEARNVVSDRQDVARYSREASDFGASGGRTSSPRGSTAEKHPATKFAARQNKPNERRNPGSAESGKHGSATSRQGGVTRGHTASSSLKVKSSAASDLLSESNLRRSKSENVGKFRSGESRLSDTRHQELRLGLGGPGGHIGTKSSLRLGVTAPERPRMKRTKQKLAKAPASFGSSTKAPLPPIQ